MQTDANVTVTTRDVALIIIQVNRDKLKLFLSQLMFDIYLSNLINV